MSVEKRANVMLSIDRTFKSGVNWAEEKSGTSDTPAIMATHSRKDVTALLADWSEGDHQALNELMPLVYDELHRLASHYLRRERAGHTLQTTALVHEAYLKLVDQSHANLRNRVQFFSAAANVMRHVLIDYARQRKASKRGGDHSRLSLDKTVISSEDQNVDVLDLNEALKILASFDVQQSRVVELRVFGGCTVEETAEALGISPRTVKREWSMAKAWLHRQLTNM